MATGVQTSPSPPFPTGGLGPCELSSSESHSTFLYYQRWVFRSAFCNDKVHCGEPCVAAAADGAVIKDQIIRFLQLLMQTNYETCLVQFWGLVKIGNKTYLTTRDHPFALCYRFDRDVEKLCEYRNHCLEYLIPVDDDEDDGHDQVQLIIGPPGRVFRGGLPEYTTDVRHYTGREYPQRDYAVGRARGYWAFPIYHPTRDLPIGVLEIASPHVFDIARYLVPDKLQNLLQEVNLTTIYVRLAKASSCHDQQQEIAIIDEAWWVGGMIHRLGRPRIWIASRGILSSREGLDFIREGQGVVGRAFSSKRACFCRDVGQLSITEYPLVPTARCYSCSVRFAVCLQSSCSSNCIYVLEFFLPGNKKDHGVPRTLLSMLMETLKEHLQNSFKIASGQELGQKLTVEVLKVSPEDEFDSFEICSTTGIKSTPRLEEVQGGDRKMQRDFSSQQVDAANGSMDGIHNQQNGSVGSTPRLAEAQGGEGIRRVDFSSQHMNGVHGQQVDAVQFRASNLAGVDVAHNSMNGNYEQQNGIVESSPRQEHAQNVENIAHGEPITEINVANPQRDGSPSCTLESQLGITREVLEQISEMKLDDAAKAVGVSRSTLKRKCRKCGIDKWPPRKARTVDQAFAEQRVVQPSTENMEERHRPDSTRLEDDRSMWVINVKYQEDKIKFELPSSARKIDLEKNIAERFNLSFGSFKIKYQDEENEWIWIASDTDLSFCMKTLRKLGRTTIEMLVS